MKADNQRGKRVAEIEILRIMAAIAIMLYHMNLLRSGLLMVEFFALLSGILLAKSLKAVWENPSGCSFCRQVFCVIRTKVNSFYLYLLVASLLGLLCFNYVRWPLERVIDFIVGTFAGNLLLLKMSGIPWARDGACPPAWYLSSMFFSLLLVVPYVSLIKRFQYCLVPGLGLFLYLCCNIGGVLQNSPFEKVGNIYCGNLRIASELLIGVGVFPLIERVSLWIAKSKFNYNIVKIFRYVFLAGGGYLLFVENGWTDVLFVLFVLFYLVGTFAISNVKLAPTSACIFKNQFLSDLIKHLGAVSIAIFLTHSSALCISGAIVKRLEMGLAWYVILSFLVTAFFSMVTIWLVVSLKRILC